MLNHPTAAPVSPTPAAPPILLVWTQAARINLTDLAYMRAAGVPWVGRAMKSGPHSDDDGLKVEPNLKFLPGSLVSCGREDPDPCQIQPDVVYG